jgi:hypothetical protein
VGWLERFIGEFNLDHSDTLRTRSNIAIWTEKSGDAREALRLFQKLLPDQQRVLGADHPSTLTTRSNIATCTGETRDAREALRLFHELLPVYERVLGPSHPNTITVRKSCSFLQRSPSDD